MYSDPSQCDANTRDYWMNMQAVTVYLKKLSEQNPAASYYNVDVLKYQVRVILLRNSKLTVPYSQVEF